MPQYDGAGRPWRESDVLTRENHVVWRFYNKLHCMADSEGGENEFIEGNLIDMLVSIPHLLALFAPPAPSLRVTPYTWFVQIWYANGWRFCWPLCGPIGRKPCRWVVRLHDCLDTEVICRRNGSECTTQENEVRSERLPRAGVTVWRPSLDGGMGFATLVLHELSRPNVSVAGRRPVAMSFIRI